MDIAINKINLLIIKIMRACFSVILFFLIEMNTNILKSMHNFKSIINNYLPEFMKLSIRVALIMTYVNMSSMTVLICFCYFDKLCIN